MKIGSLSELQQRAGPVAEGATMPGGAGPAPAAVQPRTGMSVAPDTPGPDRPVGVDLNHILGSLNRLANDLNTSLKLQIDEGTGRVMVSVVDINTGEIIKEIPPPEIIKAFSRLQEAIGMIFDRKM